MINAYNVMEYGQLHIEGLNVPQIKPTSGFFIERVKILHDMILPGWDDNKFNEEIGKQPKNELEAAHVTFRAVLGLLHRRGNIRFKPPRDPAD